MNFGRFWAFNQPIILSDIKSSYAKQSKVYHPEDDPENFQRLQKGLSRGPCLAKSHLWK